MTCWRRKDYGVTIPQRQSDVGAMYTSPPRENKQTEDTHTRGSYAQMHLNSCIYAVRCILHNIGERWRFAFPWEQDLYSRWTETREFHYAVNICITCPQVHWVCAHFSGSKVLINILLFVLTVIHYLCLSWT